MCRTHAHRGTGMHAPKPDVTALHVCLVKCMRVVGSWGHAARLHHGQVRIWCSGASVNRAVMRLHAQITSLPCLHAYLHGVAHDSRWLRPLPLPPLHHTHTNVPAGSAKEGEAPGEGHMRVQTGLCELSAALWAVCGAW
jgi:hypothetical protein